MISIHCMSQVIVRQLIYYYMVGAHGYNQQTDQVSPVHPPTGLYDAILSIYAEIELHSMYSCLLPIAPFLSNYFKTLIAKTVLGHRENRIYKKPLKDWSSRNSRNLSSFPRNHSSPLQSTHGNRINPYPSGHHHHLFQMPSSGNFTSNNKLCCLAANHWGMPS